MMRPARCNPFAMERLGRELPFDPRWCVTDWASIMSRLERHDWWGLVAGPHGSGKTTFLDAIAPRLEARQFRVHRLILNDENPGLAPADWDRLEARPADDPRRDFWLLDGAERLGPLAWRRFRRASGALGGLIITAHQVRGARLPLLLETRTSPEMLGDFIHRLSPGWEIAPSEIEALHRETGGNLREALWRCYDRLAELPVEE